MCTHILLMLGSVSCLIYFLMAKKRVEMPPSYPGALPLIGHAHLLLGDSKALWKRLMDFERYCVTQGGVIHITLGPQTYYLITDPEDFLTALSNCLEKNFIFRVIVSDWVGNGLVAASVAVWKNLSKLLSPAFNHHVSYEYIGVHNSQAKVLVSRLEEFSGKGPFNPMVQIKRAAFEVNMLTVFGLELTDSITGSLEEYMKAIDQIMNIFSQRVQKVWLHLSMIYNWTALKKQQDAAVKIIDDFSYSIIKQKREALDNKSKTGFIKPGKFKSFMDLTMELSAGGILSDEEIKEQLNSIVFAGYETTSTILTSALVVLGSYPQVQGRVYEELQEVLKGINQDVRKEDLPKLFYLEAVLKEVCRLHSVLPVLLRYVEKDVKLISDWYNYCRETVVIYQVDKLEALGKIGGPGKIVQIDESKFGKRKYNRENYTMKAGSHCAVMVHAINRDKVVWGPDSESFRPERWLEDTLPDNSNIYTGFGAGRRACTGKHISFTLMKIMLVHLLRRYKVSSDVTKLESKLELTLKPAGGCYISIVSRH